MTRAVSASNTLVFSRPAAEVFAFFADAENDPVWRSGVLSIRRIGAPGVGARYEQVVAGPGGRGISADIRVKAFEPGRRLVFETVTGPVHSRGEYTFQEAGDGTAVTFSLSAELSAVKALLIAGAVQRAMDSEVAGLAKARQHLEANAG